MHPSPLLLLCVVVVADLPCVALERDVHASESVARQDPCRAGERVSELISLFKFERIHYLSLRVDELISIERAIDVDN